MAYDKPFETLPNTGSLFSVATKTSEKSPDYRGDIVLEPHQYRLIDGKIKISIAGWKKQTKAGKTFLSLKASDGNNDDWKTKTQSPTPRQQAPAASMAGIDDDIPF